MRIAFAGTPDFAATALATLLAERFEVALVLTQPDRPAGRGQRLQASAVKQLALAHGLPLLQPQGLRLDGRHAGDAKLAHDALLAARVDAMVVVAYGLIVPDWVLQAPRLGCLNIHGSLLPRWRGAAPIQRALEAGDAQTGITIIRMDAGLDTGDMLFKQALPIGPEDSSASLYARLAPVGAALVVHALREGAAGRWQPVRQGEDGVSYATKIDKAEAPIDWRDAAAVIERRLRAFDPFPGCSFDWQGQSFKLWRARVVDALPGSCPPGHVECSALALKIQCGEGAIEVLELQRPGARRVVVDVFLKSPGALN